MTHDECRSLEELIQIVVKYHPDADVALVEKAYHFAQKAHEGQMRKSGEPYFFHPLTVAGILAKLMLDPPTIAAGLLHDTVEDCEDVTIEVVTREFGQDVALLVDGVTKLKRLDFARLVGEVHSPDEAPEIYDRLAKNAAFPIVQFDWTKLE